MAFTAAHSTVDTGESRLNIDEVLLDATIRSTSEGLQMTGIAPTPVGASRFLAGDKEFSVLVSLWGDYAGSMYINLSRHAALHLAGGFLGEEISEVDDDLFDCVCELGNMVAGRFKENVRGTRFGVETISLPALIVGANYNLHHSRGIVTASVTFEIEDMPMYRMRDKFFHVSASLMQR
jgi:chemotaxis protein CheX